ncbi:MAG: ABC transporter permease, partial [Lachnospiraceae bacterium]|nr:ABC transporter permease [Lachnospiraceae bacterium]
HLFDYRLLSTIGFDKDDVEAVSKIEGVEAAEGSIQADIITEKGDERYEYRFHMLTETMNQPVLKAGRMPEKNNECLGDSVYFTEEDIGREVILSKDNDKDDLDMFRYRKYTITGICADPLYITKIRTTTSLGDGSLDGALYVKEGAFDSEYYTELYVYTDADRGLYSEEYENRIDELEDNVKQGAIDAVEGRFNDLKKDAEDELADAEKEYEDGLKEYREKRADGEKELSDAREKLTDARSKLNDAEKELQDSYDKLQDARKELEENAEKLYPGSTSPEDAYEKAAALYEEKRQEFLDGIKSAREQLSYARAMGMITEQEYAYQSAAIDAQQEAGAAELQTFYDSLELYREGLEQYAEGVDAYNSGLEAYNSARSEYEKAVRDYDQGVADFNKETADAEEELADARQKIDDAREELDDLDEPEVYILDRSTNMGYASFDSDSDVVKNLAKFLPVFFFLIAALVCSTTMTRMVDEERTQMGILGAIGYGKSAVISKYLIYAGLAAIIGCLGGYFLGGTIFPLTIWTAYSMLYNVPRYAPFYDPWLFVISFAVSIICSVVVTYISCRTEMRKVPAELIRPKAPGSGKRILLEKVGAIWNRLSFLHKVTLRNIFRFKKRMIMMILGIAGCTALVVTAFGLNDSIVGIANDQFDDIQVYDIDANYKDTITEKDIENLKAKLGDDLVYSVTAYKSALTVSAKGRTKDVYVVATNDPAIKDVISFHDGGRDVDYPKRGEALLTAKLAKLYGLRPGDTAEFTFSETHTIKLKVSDVCDNYVYNYIYVTADTYRDIFGEYDPETVYITLKDGTDTYNAGAAISNLKGVSLVQVNDAFRDMVDKMMQSMDYVIGLVLFCAAALAFIVLFNLGNINITEREREIATLKVIGFHRSETGSYVFRENMILTLIGIFFGVFAGKLLHSYVLSQIVVEMVSFKSVIKPMSIVLSVLMVIMFAVITDLVLRRKINRIDMAGSLKSVE